MALGGRQLDLTIPSKPPQSGSAQMSSLNIVLVRNALASSMSSVRFPNPW